MILHLHSEPIGTSFIDSHGHKLRALACLYSSTASTDSGQFLLPRYPSQTQEILVKRVETRGQERPQYLGVPAGLPCLRGWPAREQRPVQRLPGSTCMASAAFQGRRRGGRQQARDHLQVGEEVSTGSVVQRPGTPSRWPWLVRDANKIERKRQRDSIEEYRRANEDQAKMMMEVSADLMAIIQKRIIKADAEGENIPMGLLSGLMRAAANISDSGRQSWATALGVGQLMQVVDQELEEVQVEIMDEEEDEAYDIPIEE